MPVAAGLDGDGTPKIFGVGRLIGHAPRQNAFQRLDPAGEGEQYQPGYRARDCWNPILRRTIAAGHVVEPPEFSEGPNHIGRVEISALLGPVDQSLPVAMTKQQRLFEGIGWRRRQLAAQAAQSIISHWPWRQRHGVVELCSVTEGREWH